MLGEPEVDRGHTEVSRTPTTPCPPLPFIAARTAVSEGNRDLKSPTRRNALAMAIAALAIVVLGTLVVTGERGAKNETGPTETLPESAVVARVTADGLADRVQPTSGSRTDGTTGHGENEPKGSHQSGNDDPGSDDPPSSDGGGLGGGGGDADGGGGEESDALATVKLPVVGTVTVDEPEVPPLPDGDVPEVPGVTVPEVEGVDLP